MIYGLLIAAGNQSRFSCSTPKALMPYKEGTLLDYNIKNMNSVCDKVFVVTSFDNSKWFSSYTNQLVIKSGWGCGDAVMRALAELDLKDDDTVFIQWSDSLHTPEIYKDLILEYSKHHKWLVPCVQETNPYVQIIPHSNDKLTVNFSKYGEPISQGYHDLSLFFGNAIVLQEHLVSFANTIHSSDPLTLYKHKHGNEMQFLDVFNETSLQGVIVEYSDYPIFCFNTLDEFNSLLK